ncbi:MAG: outer membrane protein assembly factor BamA [Desulfobacterales bacterium]|nr:outer membrane protein assembly factor BamA [Desulfobacterales bacterium]MBS3756339.1 outer membrane protein assembly factor BamA [Desulfobacterales bacterium]
MRIGFSTIAAISLFFVLCVSAGAQSQVKEVKIQGNQRIEDAAILRVIKTSAGDAFDRDRLSADLEAIYQMGYFDDVRVAAEETEDGRVVIFTVEEKPTLRTIEVTGNRVYDDEEVRENIDISSGAILNISRIKRNVRAIETMYKELNYHNVKVDYEIEELDHNRADLIFTVEEGKKVRIREIRLEGNKAYSDKALKKIMKTSEKGFFSWLTSSGELDAQRLEQDVMRLEAHYQNNGYADARVAEPEVEYEGDWIYVTIKIHEGPRYKVGEISFQGELIRPADELQQKVSIDKQAYYSREVLRNDVITLSDLYADQGYARADVRPGIKKREDADVIDVAFHLKKNQPIYFEKIVIEGNTKTRDKVIRRELKVHEQEKYSASRLKRSVRNLHRLDYFEDVNVKTRQGESDDRMILNIDVTEKATGSFSFGAGYSAVEKLYVMGSVSERNFLGRGQKIELRAQTGSESRQFRFLFTEPWLFDIPLSATVEAYNWQRDYDDYERDSKGGKLRFGYPLFDYTRGYVTYAFDVSEVSDINPDYSLLIEEGRFTESSLTTSIVYDSRDRAISPTEGSRHVLSLQYAGLGGDVGYAKTTAELGKYFPLFWSTVGFLHAEGGYVKEVGDKYLPDYEKFYLGGINSLRGFDWRDVSVRDANDQKIGGEKFVQFNAEFIFPLIEKAGLRGLLFYDTGNVYKEGTRVDLGELRESAGFGIRWYSPMGPIRLERGYILDRKKNEQGEYIEDSGRWEFAIGGAF